MIKMEIRGDKIFVESPYSRDFIAHARQAGGKWQRTHWTFPLDAEDIVRRILFDIYGTDGSPQERVTIELPLDEMGNRMYDKLIIGDRLLLKKWGRDRAPILGDGVIVIAGKLRERGGSRNNPCITYDPGTVIRAKNILLSVVEKMVARGDDIRIV